MMGDIAYWLAIVAVIVVALGFIASFFVNDDKSNDKKQDNGRSTEQ